MQAERLPPAGNTLLSIVTPVFNGERYIAKCLDNVIAQDAPGIEHIVMDGGSRDATPAIVREYQSLHPHIHLVSEPDRGQSDALNKGIRRAAADYVGLLNVDDSYDPGVLNRILGIIATLDEPHLLVGNCRVVGDDGEVKEINRPYRLDIESLLIGFGEGFYPHPYNPVAYFYHKAAHDRVGWYDVDEQYAMDLKFILAAVQAVKTAYYDEIWGTYLNIEGTKTIEDIRSGRARKRRIRIYLRELARQSPRSQAIVISKFLLYYADRRLRRLRARLGA
jgi:glycosyltransferase involved in cell wall biosynthesis